MGPRQKCAEEALPLNRLGVQAQSPIAFNSRTKEVGLEEPPSSGPDYPPGFENVIGLGGAAIRIQAERKLRENVECKDSLEEKGESVQSSWESVDKVPQTPLLLADSKLQSEDIEAVTPWEKNLIEAQIT